MRPIFGNNYHKAVFLCALFYVISAPFWAASLLSADTRYRLVPSRMGVFEHQATEITNQKTPIDVLFLGSSSLWTAIDHNKLDEIAKTEGRPALNTLTLAGNWRGEDLLYLQLRDLLKNREVHHIIISPPNGRSNGPHPASKYLWDLGSDWPTVAGLPTRQRLAIYAESALVSPRLLWAIVFPPKQLVSTSNMKQTRGSLLRPLGWKDWGGVRREFADAPIVAHPLSVRDVLYCPSDVDIFLSDKSMINPFEAHFFSLILALADQSEIPLTILNIPTPDTLGGGGVALPKASILKLAEKHPVVSLTAEQLFPGKTRSEWVDYYYNPQHANISGAQNLSVALSRVVNNLSEVRCE